MGIEKQATTITLTTAAMKATADIQTGVVSFSDREGNFFVAERKNNGRNMVLAIFEGEPLYTTRQTFQTSADDAFYGLGQHQEAENYQRSH